jgi:putative aldouronate transport system permease protein
MSIPFMLWLFVFRYLPLWGWTMAFQNYKPGKGFWEQTWVGFHYFIELFTQRDFYLALRNTLAMSLMGLAFGFAAPILFALLVNEIRWKPFKGSVQTISYLPHFISWVIAANMITQMLSIDGGAVNGLLLAAGLIREPIQFMALPKGFWWIVTFSDMWKETGWNSIIYLAAIAGVDPALYEAAKVDGAGRLRRVLHITLPGIRPTVSVILIMNIGWLLSIGFERQMLLGNAVVQKYALVLDYHALQYGIALSRYAYGTAVGIFKSAVSILLLVLANKAADKVGDGKIL